MAAGTVEITSAEEKEIAPAAALKGAVTDAVKTACTCGAKHTEPATVPAAEPITAPAITEPTDMEIKAGRRISAKNEKCLSTACAHMQKAMAEKDEDDGAMTATCHTMVSKAHDLVRSVIDGEKPKDGEHDSEDNNDQTQNPDGSPDGNSPKSAEQTCAGLFAISSKSASPLDLLEKAAECIESYRRVVKQGIAEQEDKEVLAALGL